MMEEVDGRLAVTDVDSNGQRYVKFCIDEFHSNPAEEQAAHHVAEEYVAERERQQLPASILAFPVFSERSAESRAPRTPERREGLTPGHNTGYASASHHASPGFALTTHTHLKRGGSKNTYKEGVLDSPPP